MYQGILFDLDGTLMNTEEGVKKSVIYTIHKMGLEELKEDLDSFIGPPIYYSLKNKFHLSDDEAKIGTEIFRTVYKEKYLLEAKIYPNLFELLEWLKEHNIKIGVATYKREDYAIKILKHFKIAEYCDSMVGSDFENKMTKTDIVEKCFHSMNIRKEEAVLVGDTIHDAKAAKDFGIDFIGVTYGFGLKIEEEWRECKFLVDNVLEIKELFNRIK